MFLHIEKVEYVKDYKLRLLFNNGVVKEVDLKNELYGEVFETLKDKEEFKKVRLNPETGTIEWETGADFAPEFLFDTGIEIKQTA